MRFQKASAALENPVTARPAGPPWNRWDAAALLLVLVIAVAGLPQPFAWDQALFAANARELHAGGVIYRDVWDVKQPGIYLFYWLAGERFGFSETGIHALECLWNLALALATLTLLRGWFRTRWGPAAAALLGVGYTCAIMRDRDMTQVESLVGLPLLLCAGWSIRPGTGPLRFRGAVLSGIAAGIVLMFKLVFAPIVAAFWLMALIDAAREEPAGRFRRAAVLVGGFALGASIPLGAAIVWLGSAGVLSTAWTIWTVESAGFLERAQQSGHRRLVRSTLWFLRAWAPVLILAIAGVLSAVRARGIGSRMIVWGLAGALVIFIQRWSYWQYQFFLFAVPLGVLASLGAESFVAARLTHARTRGARRLALAALALAAAGSAAGAMSGRVQALVGNDFALTESGRIRYMEAVSSGDQLAAFRRDTELLRSAQSRPGPIYVLGNPIIDWIARRRPATPRHGSVLVGFMSPADWDAVTARLRARPPAYVVLENGYFDRSIAPRPQAASFFGWLDQDCSIVRRGESIVIYAPHDSARGQRPAF